MASPNGSTGGPLRATVERIKTLTVQLLAEHDQEVRDAAWPTRRSSPFEATVGRGGPSDPTHLTAAHPDRTNTARAREIETTLRRVYGYLDDFARQLNQPPPPPDEKGWCGTCRQSPARCRGECSACYAHRRRHGEQRPAHLIERARRRADKAPAG